MPQKTFPSETEFGKALLTEKYEAVAKCCANYNHLYSNESFNTGK